MSNSKGTRKLNEIEMIKKYINANRFRDGLLNDDMFFFHEQYNSHGDLILGSGKKTSHLHIMMTSKRMFSNISYKGIKQLVY